MKLTLIRDTFTDNSTIGSLLIDGKFFCYTLEDRDRGLDSCMTLKEIEKKKLKGATAIPYGTYEVIINFSNRFKKLMSLLLKVPGFQGIRIHAGNVNTDTEGCPLLGLTKSQDFVGNSRKAYALFFPKLEAALKKGKVFIEIKKVTL